MIGDAFFEAVNPSGAIQTSSVISDFEIFAAKGIPGSFNTGCIAVGRDTTANLPRAIRFRTNATQVYSVLDATRPANEDHHHRDLDVGVFGDAAIVGTTAPGFTLTSLSNTGSGPTFFSYDELRLPKIRNSTEIFAALITDLEGTFYATFSREDGTNVRRARLVDGFTPTGYVLTGPNVMEIAHGAGVHRFNATTWGSATAFAAPTVVASTALSSTRGVSVGSQSDGAAIALSDGVSNGLGRSLIQAPSGAARTLVASKPLPDGSIAMIAKQSNLSGVSLVALRYRPDGNACVCQSASLRPCSPRPCKGGRPYRFSG